MAEKTTTTTTKTTKTGSGDGAPSHPGPLDKAKGDVQGRVTTSKTEKTVTEKRTTRSS